MTQFSLSQMCVIMFYIQHWNSKGFLSVLGKMLSVQSCSLRPKSSTMREKLGCAQLSNEAILWGSHRDGMALGFVFPLWTRTRANTLLIIQPCLALTTPVSLCHVLTPPSSPCSYLMFFFYAFITSFFISPLYIDKTDISSFFSSVFANSFLFTPPSVYMDSPCVPHHPQENRQDRSQTQELHNNPTMTDAL